MWPRSKFNTHRLFVCKILALSYHLKVGVQPLREKIGWLVMCYRKKQGDTCKQLESHLEDPACKCPYHWSLQAAKINCLTTWIYLWLLYAVSVHPPTPSLQGGWIWIPTCFTTPRRDVPCATQSTVCLWWKKRLTKLVLLRNIYSTHSYWLNWLNNVQIIHIQFRAIIGTHPSTIFGSTHLVQYGPVLATCRFITITLMLVLISLSILVLEQKIHWYW